MPVRIYDIARKLGLESKVVLSKAKELGITNAKVASSTLDKITAEYLEERLTPFAQIHAASGAAEVAATPAEETIPTPAPVSTPPSPVQTPLPEEPPQPPATLPAAAESEPSLQHAMVAPIVADVPSTALGDADIAPSAPEVVRVPSEDLPTAAEAAPEPARSPLPTETLVADAVPSVAESPAPPAATSPKAELTGQPVPETRAPAPPAAAPIAASPEPPAAPSVPTPATPPPAAPIPASPPTRPVPPPPPAPRVPGIGELVGRIELPQRNRPPARPTPAPQAPPPGPRRPEPPPRGRMGPPAPGGPRQTSPGGGPPQRSVSAPAQPKSAVPANKGPVLPAFTPPAEGKPIALKPPIIVRDLAEKMGVKAYRLLHDLMELGVFANLNQAIDEKVAQFIAARHGFRFEVERREKGAGQVHAPPKKVDIDVEDKADDLKPRPPVITIMGHVDHGKTSLLDVIRKANVAAKEAGGITQHIGAYTIQVPHPERAGELQQLTFLDTPGHAAFSAMRARGANVTDIVILVVAASEGVMPQTVEALNHAKAAKVPIMVAVNKCDLPAANPLRTRQELQEHGLVPEEWGGETIFVDVSATTRKGVDNLLSMLVLQADILELKANPNRRAKGNVIESGLEPGGPTATVLVRKGTLRQGDVLLCGQYYGRTRALISEEGQRLKEAGPSVAVKVLGLNGVPEAGLEFAVVENERVARTMAEEREMDAKSAARERGPRVTLENLLTVIEQQSAKVLKVVVKADTQGSVEAIVEALKKIDSTKVTLEVVHSAVGTISKDDVMLSASAKGIIVGFHTRMDNGVPAIAKREGVQIKQYEIIYELIDEVRNAMAGLLDPELREVTLGAAEVRQIFELSKGGKVAGCMVLNGRIVKGKARVVRRKEVIHDGILQTLRRYQDEVSEVRSGLECGIRVTSFEDFQVGDVVESFMIEKVAQQL